MTASNSLGTGEPSAHVTARTQGAGKDIWIYYNNLDAIHDLTIYF